MNIKQKTLFIFIFFFLGLCYFAFASSSSNNGYIMKHPIIYAKLPYGPISKTKPGIYTNLSWSTPTEKEVSGEIHGMILNQQTVTYTPANILQAYNFGNFANGQGETIAIIDAGYEPTLITDINTFDATYNLPAADITTYNVDGTSTDNSWEQEIALDVEWAHALAPNAKIDLVLAAQETSQGFLDAINYAINLTPQPTVISMSWGGPENNMSSSDISSYESAFTIAASKGIILLASAGDDGAYNGESSPNVNYPASSPEVIGVGGTTLTLNTSGDYESETAWFSSGGGYSSLFPEPDYQSNANISDSVNARGVPDVAFDADPNTGVSIYQNGWYTVGGTSLSCPCWAAIVADNASVNQNSSFSLTLNRLYSTFYGVNGSSSLYSSDFHDITSGNNGYYSAGTGWDAVTGIGTPNVSNLLTTYTITDSVSGGNGTVSPATQTVNYGSSASISISPNTGYQIASITDNGTSEPITDSSGETYTINNVSENHTIVVTFSIATYTITASVSNGNGTVSPATQTVDYGSSPSISITPNTGYQIASITDNGTSEPVTNSSGETYIINNVSENHTVVVTFGLPYTVIASVNGGNGTVSPTDQTIVSGNSASITITPNTGYGIASITDNGTSKPVINSSGETYTINNVSANHTVVVTFALLYTVTASVNGSNGSVLPTAQTIVSGNSASIAITPNTGYQISSITDNGTSEPITNSSGETYTINNVSANHTVVVTFSIITYTINASVSGGNGTVFPTTQTVDYGSSPSITITPNTGYGIASITDNGTSELITNSSGETYTINNISANHTIIITFANLTLNAIAGQNNVTLQWITGFTGIDSFIVQRKHPTPAAPNPSFTTIATLSATDNTFVDSGDAPISTGNYRGSGYFSDGRPYYYRVVAFTQTNTETSNETEATPSAFPPGQNPTNLQFLPGYNSFTVTWTNNTTTDTSYYLEIWNTQPSDTTYPDSIIAIPGQTQTGLMSQTVSVSSGSTWYASVIAQNSSTTGYPGFSLYATASNGQNYEGGSIFSNAQSVQFSGGGGSPVEPLAILLIAILLLLKFVFSDNIIKKPPWK